MSLNALIDKNLRTAYRLLKDKVTTVTFNTRAVGDFDFATGLPATDVTTTVNVDAVIIDDNKPKLTKDARFDKEKRNLAKSELMFQKQDLGDITLYDSVTIAGDEWNIGEPIKNDGHIVILQVTREK